MGVSKCILKCACRLCLVGTGYTVLCVAICLHMVNFESIMGSQVIKKITNTFHYIFKLKLSEI